MESYEKEWLAGQPVLLAILHCVGLFDRPASGDCLEALRAKPAIAGLTDALVDLSDEQWRRAVVRPREVRLFAPAIRRILMRSMPILWCEWSGERLKVTNEAAWKEAHSRLYDHLRDTTKEGPAPTLADLAPLYHAIAHGCRAGRHQEALNEVYVGRICRRLPDGSLEFYASKKLGAVGGNLAAISLFFEQPYEQPVKALFHAARAFVVSQASLGLRAQGRLREALQAMRASLRMSEETKNWRNAAADASNLTQTAQLVGDVTAAVAMATTGAAYANRGRNPGQMVALRADHAAALHAAGELQRAADLFADAERMQGADPAYPLLHALAGYLYCDLLLSLGRLAEASDRAARTLEWSRPRRFFAIANDKLTLGRAHLALALKSLNSDSRSRRRVRVLASPPGSTRPSSVCAPRAK